MRMRPDKLILIGLDGLSPEILKRSTESGDCPRLAGLLAQGSFASVHPVPPIDGPTNWTSLATGTWPGTHGQNSFVVHAPGEGFAAYEPPPGRVFPTLADTSGPQPPPEQGLAWIWQTFGHNARTAILVNFPLGPSNGGEKVITVRGSGPGSCPDIRLTDGHLFATRESECQDYTNLLRTTTPSGWANPPDSARTPLEVAFIITGEADLQPTSAGWMVAAGSGEPPTVDPSLMYCCLLTASERSGTGEEDPPFDTLVVCRGRDAQNPVARLKVDEWSDWICEDLKTPNGEVKAKFKLHLRTLSPGGREIILYRSPTFNADGWADPPEVAEALIEAAAADPSAFASDTRQVEPAPAGLREESLAEQARSIAWTCRELCSAHDWGLLVTHLQAPDALLHEMMNELHPASPHYQAEREQQAWGRLRQEMMMLDRFVGELIDSCGTEETAIAVVSDHGMIPTCKYVWPGRWLVEAGLTAYVAEEGSGTMGLHWPDTRAVLGDCPMAQNVWVNLKGRDPEGIVEPEEYEAVRTEVINVLLSARDPDTGACPVALALRREDAQFLGQWGDRVGDIVYFFAPGYTNDVRVHSAGPVNAALTALDAVWAADGPLQGAHHAYLPGARVGDFSVNGILLLCGPGVREGFERRAPLWSPDVAPTLCRLMGFGPPETAEGTVAEDLFRSDDAERPA